ncbi:MAG: methyl-accepting chemotaxis protein [Pseudomonadota bacterium]
MKLFDRLFNRLAALRIGTQMLGAFLLVLALTVVVGCFALVKLSEVNKVSSELARKWMPAVGHTTTMRTAMLESFDLQTKHASAADAGYMDDYEEKMKAALVIIDANKKKFEQSIGDTDERKLFESFSKRWADYQAINAKVLSLGRAKKQEDAKEIAEGAGKSASDDAILALDKLTDYNFKGGDIAAANADKVYKVAKMWLWSLLASAVAVGLIMALTITRGLLKMLGGEPMYATQITREIAEGHLSVNIALKKNDETSLLHAIGIMRDNFSSIVEQVRQGSAGVATASADIAQGNKDLSARTEQQAGALEETAASMEELDATVKKNADSAQQANQFAASASKVAIEGGEVVAKVVQTMKGINEASRKISDIIGVIDSIAFQTNILALNAAVEAARAGEQGRGFAVVASEVRSLAGRSAEAAKEIKSLINASVERVSQGTLLVDQAGVTMSEVVSGIGRVADIMGDISTASHEQASGVTQIGEAIMQMDQTTQQNATLVQETAVAATKLESQAQELVRIVAVFR